MAVKKKIVRPGQKKPFEKSTREETEERIQAVESLLRAGPILKGQLVRIIRSRFGVEHRMAENYIARAKERLVLRVNEAKDNLRAESMAYYEGVILNANASMMEKLRARERIDKLLGLDVPQTVKLDHTGSVSTGVDIETLNLDIATRKRLLAAVRKTNGTE